MNISGTLPIILCTSIIFIPMIVGGIYATKARIRYVTFTNELRKRGEYTKWSSNNRILLFSESYSIYAFIICFFGFIIAGIFQWKGVAKFFFMCFIIFCLLGMISGLMLYRKVPKD